MASPAFVASQRAWRDTFGTLTVTDPGGGNFVLAFGVAGNVVLSGLPTPSGWTQLGSPVSVGDSYAYVWYALRTSSPVFDWSVGADDYVEIHVSSYSGVYATPLDAGCTGANAFGTPAVATSWTPPSLTAQSAETLSVVLASNWSTGWSSPPTVSGYTMRFPPSLYSGCGGDKAVAAAGVVSPPAIALAGGGASNGIAIHVLLASQAAGGGGGSTYTPPRRAARIAAPAPDAQQKVQRRARPPEALSEVAAPIGVAAPFPDADAVGLVSSQRVQRRARVPVAVASAADHAAALVEAGWTASGVHGVAISHAAALAEAGWTVSASQSVAVDHAASLAEAGWVAASSATFVGPGADHSAALLETGWTAAGTHVVAVDHTGALAEAGWSASAAQAVSMSHTAALADAGWTASAAASFAGSGVDHAAALVDAGWTAAGTHAVSVAMSADLAEDSWAIAATHGVAIVHTAALVDAGWTVFAADSAQSSDSLFFGSL